MLGPKHRPKTQFPLQYHEAHFNSDTESLEEGRGQSLAHYKSHPSRLNKTHCSPAGFHPPAVFQVILDTSWGSLPAATDGAIPSLFLTNFTEVQHLIS